MKKQFKFLFNYKAGQMLLLITLFFVFLSSGSGAFEIASVGQGSRVMALGSAGAALPSNPFANFLNPAGLIGLESPAVAASYFSLANEVSFKEFNFNWPTEIGVFSFSYLQSSEDGIYQTALDEDGRPKISNSFTYDNGLFAVGFAREFDKFSAGISAKYNKQNLGSSGNGAGYNLDAGIIYPLSETQNLGVIVKNILPGRYGSIEWSTGTAEKLPMRLVLGYFQEFENIKIFSDLNFSRSEPFNLKAGAEMQAVEALVFRAGLEQVSGFGAVVSTRLTLGLGVRLGLFDFDYAYLPDAFNFNNSGHYFSLGVRL